MAKKEEEKRAQTSIRERNASNWKRSIMNAQSLQRTILLPTMGGSGGGNNNGGKNSMANLEFHWAVVWCNGLPSACSDDNLCVT